VQNGEYSLRDMGVGKGDRYIIYMPMIPEAAYCHAGLARAIRLRSISIVFAGFSPDALAARVQVRTQKVVIHRRFCAAAVGKGYPLKANADKAAGVLANGFRIKCASVSASDRAAMLRGTNREMWIIQTAKKRRQAARPRKR